MKRLLIRIFVPVVTLGLLLWGNIVLVLFLFSKLPYDLSWDFWAKALIIFGDVWLFAGLIIAITALSGALAVILTKK